MSVPLRTLELALPEEAATQALGARLAAAAPWGLVIHLVGELGTGKTTLARGLLRALGVTGPVRSPTFTLVEPYATPAGEVHHLDLYRLGDPEELELLGVRELAGPGRLLLVEWPERGGDRLPPPDLRVALAYAAAGRAARLEACSAPGLACLDRLAGDPLPPDGPAS